MFGKSEAKTTEIGDMDALRCSQGWQDHLWIFTLRHHFSWRENNIELLLLEIHGKDGTSRMVRIVDVPFGSRSGRNIVFKVVLRMNGWKASGSESMEDVRLVGLGGISQRDEIVETLNFGEDIVFC